MGMQLINIMLEAAGESLGSFPSLVTVCQVTKNATQGKARSGCWVS